VAGVAACWASLAATTAQALTPQSPEVRQAVQRAAVLLKSKLAETELYATAAHDHQVGIKILTCLALLKAEQPRDPKYVDYAVATLRAALREPQFGTQYTSPYTLGLSITYLAAADPQAYRDEIRQLLQLLLRTQMPHGGFAPVDPGQRAKQAVGDTSMMQYAMLGMWEAYQAQVAPPERNLEAAAAWLLATQNAGGSFPYEPGSSSRTNVALSAGGTASLYILGNLARQSGSESRSVGSGLPSSLSPVGQPPESSRPPLRLAIAGDRLAQAVRQGDAWLAQQNLVQPSGEFYVHYSYYALERYFAFRELWEGRSDPEPAWYTTLASHLLQTQNSDGSWGSAVLVDTAFCVLTLVRSTYLSLKQREAETASGLLVGGRGFDVDDGRVRVRGDRLVVVKPLQGPAEEMLRLLEDPSHERFDEALVGLQALSAEADEAMLAPLAVRMRRLAAGDSSPEARAAALTALARLRNLDDVPLFIHALADEDWRVVQAARDALRLISRKLDDFGVSLRDTPMQRAQAIERWKAWFRAVRPEYQFDD
jgi:hypothetical protein